MEPTPQRVRVVGPDGVDIGCEAVLERGSHTTCLLLPLLNALGGATASVIEERRRRVDWETPEECVVVRCIAVDGTVVKDLENGEEIGPRTRCSIQRVLEAADREWSGPLDREVRIHPVIRIVGDAPLSVTIPRVEREVIAERLLAVGDHTPAEEVSRLYDGLNSRIIERRVRRLLEEHGASVTVTVTAGDGYAVTGPDVAGYDPAMLRVFALDNAMCGDVENGAFHFHEIMLEIGHDVRTTKEKARDRQRRRRDRLRREQDERAEAADREETRLRLEREFGPPPRPRPCEEEDGSCTRDCPLWPPQECPRSAE